MEQLAQGPLGWKQYNRDNLVRGILSPRYDEMSHSSIGAHDVENYDDDDDNDDAAIEFAQTTQSSWEEGFDEDDNNDAYFVHPL